MARENLNDLLAFMTVAREKNFTRAAAQLGVSQSALSRTVRALEERMGLLLLTRTTRSVSPTEAGQRLLAAIAPKLDEIDAELEALSELRDRPAGTVRITAVDYAANSRVWPKLKPLLHMYPEIRVELINDYGLANIVEQRYDIGIRLGDQVEKDMVAARIGPDETLAIVGAPSYLAQHGSPKTPQDLTRHNCINLWLPTRDATLPWELRKGRRELHVRVNGQLVFNNVYQIVDAVLAGFGLAYVPKDLVASHVRAGRLEWVLEDWHPTFTGFHVYYSSRRQSSRAVALVVEALKVKTREPAKS
jgi:DNA-binding transcriptional LysR family regulator